ncbi:MAG: glycosyltransferase family 61 protein [Burkholderiales bacterium]|nr:glycosyltransferase family 61 protein [Burkholderiales bacterium]
MHSSPPHVPPGKPTYRVLTTPTLAARLHRKIRRSKKLTRILLPQPARLQLIAQSELVNSCGACATTLLSAATIPAPPKLRCIGEPLVRFDAPKDPPQFPAIQVIRTGPAVVFGHSNLVQTPNGQLVHHDLFNPTTHLLGEEYRRWLHVELSNLTAQIIGMSMSTTTLSLAAVFTDACASNYAHWLTEVLPRIVLYMRSSNSTGIPLIVDAGLHPNIYESLSIAAGGNRFIYALPKDGCVRVSNLDVVTPTGYVPFAARAPRLPGHSHGVFSPQALLAVREAFRRLMSSPSTAYGRRIYVRRNAGLRKLINDQEISNLLSAAGFDIVSPEQLSFAEQVRLFSGAELVIGPTGAAMANLIFCQPGARVHVLMAQHPEMPYWYWQRMADCVGVRLSYGLGEICDASENGFHSDFTFPLDMLEDALISFEKDGSETPQSHS